MHRQDNEPITVFPWLVVGFGFLALALAFSTRATLGLVIPALDAELGWSRSFVSGAAAAALLVMAVVAPFAGRLIDRCGVRPALSAGLLLVAVGSLVAAIAEHRLVFLVAFSGVSAVGFGIVATHVVSTAVAGLFSGRRGLATGIATAGATAGQFLIVPLVAVLLATLSWRWSFAGLGLASLALAGLLWWTLPADNARAGGNRPGRLSADIGYLLRQPVFHLLFWSFLLCGYTTTGVIETHLLAYASLCGFAPVPGATAYGTLSAVNMVGMIGAGWLADRMDRVLLLGAIYALRALAFVVLINVGSSYEMLLFFAVLFGAVDYATVPVTASLAASHLGLRVMGLAMGIIACGHAVGAAAGAMLGGLVYDATGQYESLWLSSIALSALAAGLVFMMFRRPVPEAASVPGHC